MLCHAFCRKTINYCLVNNPPYLVETKTMNLKQVLTFVAQSIVVGLAAAAVILLLMPGSSLFNSTKRADSYHTAIEAAAPAVVNVYSGNTYLEAKNPILQDPLFRRFFGESSQNTKKRIDSRGSGVIMDMEGHILTNAHVIQGAEEIFVTLRDGRETTARTIGIDSDTDLAVLQIELENLPVIPIGDSSQLRVGDIVLAIGNPYDFGQTVTQGIVSATGRKRLGITTFDNFIQTDADINPGNSGGALINVKGELIGINTAIFSQSGGNIGIGFAIPINLALQITEQLIDKGEVERGFIGIDVQNITADLAEAFGINNQQGAIVNSVLPNSPASEAGLQPGDVIVAINNKKVKNAGDVRNYVGLLPVGEKIDFEIIRAGKRIKLATKVATGRTMTGKPSAVNPRLSGVTVGNIEKDHPYYGKIAGVVVVDVERGSDAWRSGLRSGDLISSVNRVVVKDLQGFLKAIDKKKGALLFRIVRGNTAAFLVIK